MSTPRLHFSLLGPLRVTSDGEPVKLGGPKERLVLGMLVLSGSEVVSSERLIDALWEESPPDRATATLQVHVSNLRRRLGHGLPNVITQPPGYLLLTSADTSDVLRFEELASLAREASEQGDLSGAVSLLAEAEGLCRGTPLADLGDSTALVAGRMALAERRAAAEELRITFLLRLGRADEAMPLIDRMLDLHPLRESAWEQRMVALYRLGRQADALASYHRCRERLADELGVDPSPRLQHLEGAILRQDRALDLDVPPPDRSIEVVSVHDLPETDVVRKHMAHLEVEGERIPLVDVVGIGRHPESTLVLADSSISRRHAEVRPALGGHLISDLASSNGTWVNGLQVTQHLLEDGDQIRIGPHVLTYRRDPR